MRPILKADYGQVKLDIIIDHLIAIRTAGWAFCLPSDIKSICIMPKYINAKLSKSYELQKVSFVLNFMLGPTIVNRGEIGCLSPLRQGKIHCRRSHAQQTELLFSLGKRLVVHYIVFKIFQNFVLLIIMQIVCMYMQRITQIQNPLLFAQLFTGTTKSHQGTKCFVESKK